MSRTAGHMAVTRKLWLGGMLLLVPSAPARAVTPSADPAPCIAHVALPDRASTWAAPLNRVISVQLTDVSLREALERVAGAAQLGLSYSADLLPPDRRVCVALSTVPVGAALETLLNGTTMRPLVVGATQVVLAPSRPVAKDLAVAPVAMAIGRHANVLDRVVVTGAPDGAAQRGSPFALDVIEGETLAQQRAATLGEALEMAVPGIWTWSGAAGTLSARFGSIRGASSFGLSAPKVYLDGIEVANPLLVTYLDPARIDRIEVIRGPQGAALYGADAINGVVHIITRHDGTPSGALAMDVRSAVGVSAAVTAARDAFVQDHAVALRAGSGAHTAGLGATLGTVGAVVPGASARQVLADGDARLVTARTILTGTARVAVQQAALTTALGDSATGQDVAQYTVGATAAFMPTVRWTHTVTAGLDGYRLRGLATDAFTVITGATSDLRRAQQEGGDRASLRFRAVGRYDLAPRTMLTVTVGAEHATVREQVDGLLAAGNAASPPMGVGVVSANAKGGASGAPGGTVLSLAPAATSVRVADNDGVLGQLSLAASETWYLSAGARAERSAGYSSAPQVALLPMLGAAYVRDVAGAVLKVRAAYGTGIRPASTLMHSVTPTGRVDNVRAGVLEPESQTGTEIGMDLLVDRRLTVHVTRFDQRASGLVQPVATMTTYATNAGRTRSMTYTLANVGAIGNHGWEVEAGTSNGPFSLSAAASLVDSRVQQLASGYRGDLRTGDRMLDVPARTLSINAGYTAGRWRLSGTVTRAEDWIGYDRLAITSALNDTSREHELSGAQLRSYWRRYDGLTRVRATVQVRVLAGWSLLVGGDNLLNAQGGAADNATLTTGRTLTLGVRTGF